MNGWVFVGLFDGPFDIRGVLGEVVGDFDANVVTVFDFEVDVFLDDGIVAVADDEEVGLDTERFDLVGLAFFDKPSELFAA